jgi:hypothetical protein
MRKTLILLPLFGLAAPVAAQPMPPAGELQRALDDPATIDRVTDAVQAMSRAVLDMPIGNVEAAVEGRQATPADRGKTLGQLGRIDPEQVQQQIAAARPKIERSLKAFSTALPEVMDSLQRVSSAIDRAAANLPDPSYPRR